ncbi:glucosaminidase domain-containing protein [Staphylococcus haemolyticus]|uniref:glucosaminidase domain-containing protein n=1 Tax=Staphylococcus haemolyticus TaxID=1283 RepID=UPI001F0B65F8|nr:glucosaminidase domain-containing protein [Staphylococcus haemolyticus]MCH4470652.1 glucosaminidase domain-containing protein [Staphylococcus haemolyticus]MCH4491800.1 glucosaminidase domain-containing protein [Staphylococcus haemolyticus]
MGLPDPKKRKPTASEVAAWARSRIGKRLDIDGRGGAQCWDLPNYIFGRYWGFWTTGDAKHMAWYRYPKGFKFYRNTPNFIPKPGDISVWINGQWGHTNMVVGPSTKNYYYAVDQNWVNSNNWTGSAATLIKHSYGGTYGFIRPAYQPEVKPKPKPKPKPDDDKTNTNNTSVNTSNNATSKNTKEDVKPSMKKIKKVQYTDFLYSLDKELEYNDHLIVDDGNLMTKPKGIYIKECPHLRDVEELYLQRNRFVSKDEYPHVYIDREQIWTPRPPDTEAPSHPGWLVLEVCGAQTESKRQFMLNQLQALIYGVWLMSWSKIKLSESTIKADPNIWRSMKDLINYDMIKNGIPDESKYKEVESKIIEMYLKKDKLLKEKIVTTTSTKIIKIKSDKETKTTKPTVTTPSTSKSKKTTSPKQTKAKVTVEKSGFTFTQALNLQMSRGYPQKSNGYSWYFPSRSAVSAAMNPTSIWNSSSQRYQMLNLGKYQGVSVDKLNIILNGRGTLSGQGKAFAEGCKKYNINEIYLIAHALLESGNGRSYFASGSSGVYNYFGIGAYDNNPNNAISFARGRGWTTPAKAIIGGAKFVRQDYINKGQNTLYRMRWNPKNPGTHQYATDIRWCSHQASTIYSYYKKIGLKGLYFIQDKYK